MLVVLSAATIVLSLVMVYFNARKFRSSVCLGLLFMVVSLCCFSQYLVLFSPAFYRNEYLLLSIGLMAGLVGPLLYFYVRSVLSENTFVGINDLWHFMPSVLFFVGTLFVNPISVTAIFLLWPLVIVVYVVWMSARLISYVKFEMRRLVFRAQKFIIPWVVILLMLLFFVALSMLFWVLQLSIPEDSGFISTIYFLQNILMLGFVGMAISVFFFPSLLYGMPRVPLTRNISEKKKLDLRGEINTPMDAVANYRLFMQEKTDSFMEEKRPWLQARCDLAQFSKITSIPTHHLACYFKYIKKQHFNDFRNGWRIENAKKLLSQSNVTGLSLQEIGFLSGFSSQIKFFRAFKKTEGASIHTFLSQNYLKVS